MKRFLLTILPVMVFAYKIEFFNGKELSSDKLFLKGEEFVIDETTHVNRAYINRIVFSNAKLNANIKSGKSLYEQYHKEAESLKKQYPDATEIIIRDVGESVYLKDGTRLWTYHSVKKLLKEDALDDAHVSLGFSEERSKLSIDMARVLKPDGRIINVNPNDIKLKAKYSKGLVYFGKGKIITFTIPSVEVGDIIELKYTYHTFNPWAKKVFTPSFGFQSYEPVALSRFVVRIPLSETLIYKIKNFPPTWKREPEIYKKAKNKVYIWEYKNIPPMIQEDNMPPYYDVAPNVVASNQTSWDYIFNWYAAFQKARIVVTPAIQHIADSLVANTTSDSGKVAKIYHWIQKKIRYISIKGSAASGVSGHKAIETLHNGYGDCTDKSILFTTLLNAVGIEAYPVYIGTNSEYPQLDTEIPDFYGNHAITKVYILGKGIYLDPTSDNSRFPSFREDDKGVYAINAIKKEIEFIPVPDPKTILRHYHYNIEIMPNLDVKFRSLSYYSGEYEAHIRSYWQWRKKNEWEATFQSMIHSNWPYARLISYKIDNLDVLEKPLRLHTEYIYSKYIKKIKDIFIFKLPEKGNRLSFREVYLNKRTYPLTYYSSAGIEHFMRIKLPSDLSVESLPDSINIKTPYVSYYAIFTYDKINREIIYVDTFLRYKRIVPSQDYIEYKSTVERIVHYQKLPVILKKRSR